MEKYYQRFRIDDHLKRYEGALTNLKLAGKYIPTQCPSLSMLFGADVRAWATGPDHFDEAVEYLEKHRLYELGLELWSGAEEYSVCHHFSNSP